MSEYNLWTINRSGRTLPATMKRNKRYMRDPLPVFLWWSRSHKTAWVRVDLPLAQTCRLTDGVLRLISDFATFPLQTCWSNRLCCSLALQSRCFTWRYLRVLVLLCVCFLSRYYSGMTHYAAKITARIIGSAATNCVDRNKKVTFRRSRANTQGGRRSI